LRLKLSKKINISIPKPCHENWEAMTPEDKGRFCSVCTKTVFDFTKSSDKEIINHLNTEKNTCGRFFNTQLNRNLILSRQKPKYWTVFSATVFGILGIGTQATYSQVKQDTIQTEPKKDLPLDKVYFPQKRVITGVVSDDLGPVAGVNVVAKSTGKTTTSDFDGIYKIEAETGDELVFSFAGSMETIIVNNKKSNYNVTIKSVVLLGEVVIRRTFFGRQIKKVRNWFR
jgi:hypothetical protein